MPGQVRELGQTEGGVHRCQAGPGFGVRFSQAHHTFGALRGNGKGLDPRSEALGGEQVHGWGDWVSAFPS